MKLNGFSIQQLKNGLYIAINDNNPKIIKYGKDVNKLANEIKAYISYIINGIIFYNE